jgi:hypothetical protein
VHSVPINGVEAFPNNITIMRFLDLDLTNLNETIERQSNENCAQCSQKHANYFRCLDCDKNFCVNCKQSHLIQLRNELKHSVSSLRRSLPKLSQNVGNKIRIFLKNVFYWRCLSVVYFFKEALNKRNRR